ncbi:MAG: type II toxin-antitoxin system VapC family toxin [Acidobacteria bacterium]|nr:type II toxin-antitoxin system VapC family toxin [Acidobacteriota bacterium]
MRYLLDTNVCVDYLTGRFPSVGERLHLASPEEVCTSSVVVAELRYGADKSRHSERNHGLLDVFLDELRGLDFDFDDARTFGRVRQDLESKGMPIGPYDMLIAAQALVRNLILVTDNEKEFRRVEGLRVENWRRG